MRTKAQPYQLDESEKLIMVSELQMNTSALVVNTGGLKNDSINKNMTTAADSTSSEDNNNKLQVSEDSSGECISYTTDKPGITEKSTQKDYNIDLHIRNRMRELGTQVFQHEFAHRFQMQKINEIQKANFELHRQNQFMYQLLAERRPDVISRYSKRPKPVSDAPPPLRPASHIDLQQHQYLQYQLQQQQQQQHIALQHQLQQQQQQQQQATNKYQSTVPTQPQVFDIRSNVSDLTNTTPSPKVENSNVFVTQWTPQELPEQVASRGTDNELLQNNLYQQHQYEAAISLKTEHEPDRPKLSHSVASLQESSASHKSHITTMANHLQQHHHHQQQQQQQETQMWQEFYRPANPASSLNINAHANSLVTPPPSPMCSPPVASTSVSAGSKQRAQCTNQNPAFFFPPGAQSPQYYYQKRAAGCSGVTQKRHHPY